MSKINFYESEKVYEGTKNEPKSDLKEAKTQYENGWKNGPISMNCKIFAFSSVKSFAVEK